MVQPTQEQSRREAIRRVQVGMIGLFGVLMLVGLTNIVVDNVRDKAAVAAAPAASVAAGNASGPSEPLADLGVAPAPAGSEGASPVPDLEPDPRLQRPMDRDPRARH